MGKEYIKVSGTCEYVYTQRENSFLVSRRKLPDETWELSCRTYFELLNGSKRLLDRVETVIIKIFEASPTTDEILAFMNTEVRAEIVRVKLEYSGYSS